MAMRRTFKRYNSYFLLEGNNKNVLVEFCPQFADPVSVTQAQKLQARPIKKLETEIKTSQVYIFSCADI